MVQNTFISTMSVLLQIPEINKCLSLSQPALHLITKQKSLHLKARLIYSDAFFVLFCFFAAISSATLVAPDKHSCCDLIAHNICSASPSGKPKDVAKFLRQPPRSCPFWLFKRGTLQKPRERNEEPLLHSPPSFCCSASSLHVPSGGQTPTEDGRSHEIG